MNVPPLPWMGLEPGQSARCLTCGYVLSGLAELRCPECSRPFHPSNPSTFTTKPPFLAWRFWLPGLSLSVLGGMAIACALLYWGNWGAALWIAVPFSAGSILGYRVRSRWIVLVLLTIAITLCLCMGMITLDIAGIYCGMALAGIFLGLVFVGVVLGAVLRTILKHTGFSQRSHLPTIAFLLLPAVVAAIEGKPARSAHATISTDAVIEAPIQASWNAIMFYEEVKHEPPWILKVGLARPLYTVGRSSAAGDVKMCVYNKGHITKRVRQAKSPTLLEFDVIDQKIGYERDVRLVGGSFAFEALGADRTRATLTTEYEPLLRPRWVWLPFERIAVHTLHNHVLEGMKLEAADAMAANPGSEEELHARAD
jgi:hypothetical protein